MKRRLCGMAALILALMSIGCAMADQKVLLPGGSYSLMIPDGMEYDGPGVSPDDAKFAWVSAELGLDIEFFCEPNEKGAALQAMAEVLAGDGIDTRINRIGGIDMIVYQVTDPGDSKDSGMKCIGYVLEDGKNVQMICFWYATQEAADWTARIISSITKE